ncbi:MAG: helix-turn-helix domain-containing protein [Shewanella sp.]
MSCDAVYALSVSISASLATTAIAQFTDEQAESLNAQFGAVRFAYNDALSIQRHMFKRHGGSLSGIGRVQPVMRSMAGISRWP